MFAKGSARVALVAEGAATGLSYSVDAKIGGKRAQIGPKLVDMAAKIWPGIFFIKLQDLVGGAAQAAASARDPAGATSPETTVADGAANSPLLDIPPLGLVVGG